MSTVKTLNKIFSKREKATLNIAHALEGASKEVKTVYALNAIFNILDGMEEIGYSFEPTKEHDKFNDHYLNLRGTTSFFLEELIASMMPKKEEKESQSE